MWIDPLGFDKSWWDSFVDGLEAVRDGINDGIDTAVDVADHVWEDMKDGTMRDYIDGTVDASIDLFDPTEDIKETFECLGGNASCAAVFINLLTKKVDKAKDLYKSVEKTIDKPRIKVTDSTKKSSEQNYDINKSKSEFENHLLENGFTKKTIITQKGEIQVFSKNGQKEFTTRDFSKTKDANGKDKHTGELFIDNERKAKIRFENNDGG